MPKPVSIPAGGDVEYTYEIVPTHFTEDKWIQMVEVHPSSPQYVHHAVVYIRPPDSQWLRHAPVGVPFTASTLRDPQDRLEAHGTTSDLLLVYAPGQFARSLAGWNGKVHSRGIGLRLSDALHHEW